MRISHMALPKLCQDAPDDPAPHGVPKAVRALPHEALVRQRLRDVAIAAHRRIKRIEPNACDVLNERQNQLHLQRNAWEVGVSNVSSELPGWTLPAFTARDADTKL